MSLACFKAYDVRGRLGDELTEDIAWRIGRAYAEYLQARRVVVGGDMRLSTPTLKAALMQGLQDGGADVIDIGMTGTEEVYFAAFHWDVDGGIEVTASHNPMDYNGMKFVARGARPISGDSGLHEIACLAEAGDFTEPTQRGHYQTASILLDYVTHLLTYLDSTQQRPLKLLVNAGNGAAGHVIDALEIALAQQRIPITFIKLYHEPDGHFPHGIPNPLLPENRSVTVDAVRAHGADMGIAWDGDFDRCFLFDERGQFIEGYYIVGLLAVAFLARHPGEKIIHDPRLTWNTIEMVNEAGGTPIQSKTGHAFIKERMRAEDAIYGGEMSAHHYFRDFAYCDSGMIPWLLVANLLGQTGQSLSTLVAERIARYPSSGEINCTVADADMTLRKIESALASEAVQVERVDGLSIEMLNWRCNVRLSNTEPLLRINVETRGDVSLLNEKTALVLSLIQD